MWARHSSSRAAIAFVDGADDTAVDFGDQYGERLLRYPLAAADVPRAVALLASERVDALEHPQLPEDGAAFAHRATHRMATVARERAG